MNCINLKIKLNKKLYCKKYNQEITFADCNNCKLKEFANREYKKLQSKKPMKKISKKQAKIERDRKSLFTDDFSKCIECNILKDFIKIDKHEIFGGSNRLNSIKYDLVIPLCRKCHDNPNIVLKWQKIGRVKFDEVYPDLNFLNIFKRNYFK